MKKTYIGLMILALLMLAGGSALAQLDDNAIATLNQIAAEKGWTFTAGHSRATERPMSELCSLKEPANWRATARFAAMPRQSVGLPAAFDWRTNGLTSIKDQGNCGSCWAFATEGTLENAIKLKDGVTVDISEQWLVSCNQSGWGCDGGWFAHEYNLRTGGSSDSYGGNGGVLEADFPYTATDAACRGPYTHRYWVDSWAYIASDSGIPSVEEIKQAILTYGPISVGVYVSSSFQAYSSGVFNRNEDRTINHAVMLVGWDDSQGAGGVWILRNSWGSDWGENGYMRIQYNCCRVGYAACYVDYRPSTGLQVTPAENFSASGAEGGPFTPSSQTYILRNNGTRSINWSATHTQTWNSVSPASGSLAAGQSVNVTVSLNSAANSLPTGVYADTLAFNNLTVSDRQTRTVILRCGQIDYLTELFDSSGANDLDNLAFTFTPSGSANAYSVQRAAASAFSTDPAGGTTVALSDDGTALITLTGGAQVSLFGLAYSSFYLGANGYLTFGGSDTTWTESLAAHFNRPRIAALFDDLNPAAGGTVSWKQLSDRVAITFQDVREYGSTAVSSFQYELFFNGVIRLTYLGVGIADGLVGLSRGGGLPTGFLESDFSAYPAGSTQTGALHVDLGPEAALAAGARWRVDGGAWQRSDSTVSGLAAGSHTINYQEISGYTAPADEAVNVTANQTLTVSAVYAANGGGSNLALASRGSTITGTNGKNWGKLIDGQTTGYTASSGFGYTYWKGVPKAPGKMTLDLKAVCTINSMRLLLWDLDARTFKYKIEASANGKTWALVVDRSTTACRSWQELALATPVQARYLRLTGTYSSANRSFIAVEWEVYGTVGQPAAPATESWSLWTAGNVAPADVITSGGAGDFSNGWKAVDRDLNTAWSGNPARRGCWLAAAYDPAVTATNVHIVFADGSPTNIVKMASLDADTWFDLDDARSQQDPARFRYLWLIFPAADAAPEVKEFIIMR
jgi:C1A family cysteine protease